MIRPGVTEKPHRGIGLENLAPAPPSIFPFLLSDLKPIPLFSFNYGKMPWSALAVVISRGRPFGELIFPCCQLWLHAPLYFFLSRL